jgi:hypothetical protein
MGKYARLIVREFKKESRMLLKEGGKGSYPLIDSIMEEDSEVSSALEVCDKGKEKLKIALEEILRSRVEEKYLKNIGWKKSLGYFGLAAAVGGVCYVAGSLLSAENHSPNSSQIMTGLASVVAAVYSAECLESVHSKEAAKEKMMAKLGKKLAILERNWDSAFEEAKPKFCKIINRLEKETARRYYASDPYHQLGD